MHCLPPNHRFRPYFKVFVLLHSLLPVYPEICMSKLLCLKKNRKKISLHSQNVLVELLKLKVVKE